MRGALATALLASLNMRITYGPVRLVSCNRQTSHVAAEAGRTATRVSVKAMTSCRTILAPIEEPRGLR